jgi:hypothetical protein
VSGESPQGQLSPRGKRSVERSDELPFLGPVGDGKDHVLEHPAEPFLKGTAEQALDEVAVIPKSAASPCPQDEGGVPWKTLVALGRQLASGRIGLPALHCTIYERLDFDLPA